MKSITIIGCGPGGYATASYAARHGFAVTVFEKAEPGGTCLNRGCIPTKVYCHIASVILEEQKMKVAGIQPSVETKLNFAAVHARKDAVVAQLRQGVETLMSAPGITLVRGEARIKDAHTVTCDGKDYYSDYIIIATGSHSATPPIEGIDNPNVVSSTGLLAMDTLPKRLVIIGAGVIGMEMASAYSAFGTEVTVIEFLKECLPPMDQDLAKRLRKLLEKRGVKFYLNASAKKISTPPLTPPLQGGERQEQTISTPPLTPPLQGGEGQNLSVYFTQKGKELSVVADTVLVATGRKPNTAGLGLEDAGIANDRHGITVDDNLETSLKGVYAIGDVNGKVMLAHAAEQQGQQVIECLEEREKRKEESDMLQDTQEGNHNLQTSKFKLQTSKFKHQTPLIPSAVFTVPELAGVGPTETQLKEKGIGYEVHKSFYRANGKAVAMDATDGLVKTISDADGRIMACHILGAHAADIVQEATVLISLGATIDDLRHIVHIHPTLGELMKPE